MSRQRSEQEKRREVDAWRRSGESAVRYAPAHGYSASSLLKWSAAARSDHAFVRLEVAGKSPASSSTELVVEVGSVRVRVAKGFDATVLREVVAALSSEGS